MSKQAVVIYQHVDHPEWGRGVVVPAESGRADRLDLSFEMSGRRTILKSYAAKLTRVDMPAEEAQILGEKLASRRAAAPPSRINTKKPKGAAAVASFPSFEAQVRQFETWFPGGFAGETFLREERGLPEGRRRKTDKGPAIAEAAEALSQEAFASGDPEAIFEAVCELVRSTSFVHPLEGANSLGSMKPEYRGEFLESLRDLLYGTHDYGVRFDRFVASVRLEDAKGAEKRPSWPLVTMFAALVHPAEHVCVKPTFFQRQAALLRIPVDYQPRPDGLVYSQLLAVTRRTEEQLRAAGHEPRDLVDVFSFISATQSGKAPKTPKAKATKVETADEAGSGET